MTTLYICVQQKMCEDNKQNNTKMPFRVRAWLFTIKWRRYDYIKLNNENVELDVSVGSLKLSMLDLDRVKIENWKSSKWTIGKLTLCRKSGIS